MISKKAFDRGIILTADDVGLNGVEGEIKVGATAKKLQVYLDGAVRSVVTENQSQSLTNKTIDVDSNTLSNIEVDNLKSGVLNTDLSVPTPTDLEIPSALAARDYADAAASGSAAGVQSNLDNHINDTADAHDASAISSVPAGNLAATDVQGALDELQSDIDTRATTTALNDHINDATDAHDASAISNIPTGNLAATDIQGAVNELQSDIDTRVVGPASATDEALARFDGTTGKLVQNSVATLTDAGALAGLSSVSSTAATFTNEIVSGENREGILTDSLTTGANQTLIYNTAPIIILTNSGLTSISGIDTPNSGRNLTLINRTGNAITINNDSASATAANRILTGTKAALTLADQASILLKYDSVNSRFAVIGGSGAGGGASLDTIFQLTGTDIVSWSTGDNATFLGGGTLSGTFAADTTTPLQGIASYLYTQAAGSLNDYMASPAQPVDARFRGQNCTLYFPYTFNGANNAIEVIFYDATAGAVIPSSAFIQTSTTVGIFKTNIVIPSTCQSIRVGFHSRVSAGSVFEFDSVQLTADTTLMASLANRVQYSSLFQTASFGVVTITGVLTSSTNNGLFSYNSSTGVYTALTRAEFNISVQMTAGAGVVCAPQIVLNGSSSRGYQFSENGAGQPASIGWTMVLDAGQFFTVGNAAGTTGTQVIDVVATASNTNILTSPDTFSTDTAPLTYAGSATYTLSTLANAPVGTYITFKYAINSNTRTQTTGVGVGDLRPTQTNADMNTNGILVYARPYNATSTGELPAAVAIQIGKGMKGVTQNLYKSSGKVNSGSLDALVLGATAQNGVVIKEYNESTGILIFDAGVSNLGTISTHDFVFSDLSSQTSGYVTINASKNPALTGLNISAVAARGVNTSGQSIGTTPVTMTYDAIKTFDTHGALVAATGIFTAPEAGYYQVNASVLFNSGAYSLAQAVGVIGYKNAAIYSQSSQERTNAAVTQNVGDDYSDVVYLAKGDTFEIRPFNDRGATALSPSASNNFFSISKISVG